MVYYNIALGSCAFFELMFLYSVDIYLMSPEEALSIVEDVTQYRVCVFDACIMVDVPRGQFPLDAVIMEPADLHTAEDGGFNKIEKLLR